MKGQLTLRQVLEQPSLGLSLATGEQDCLDTLVTGAHSFEISRPTRWFSPHWIALTTGLRLKGRPSEQRDLIYELKSAGIVALGFAIGINFQTVPQALVNAATESQLPIFTVPFATRFAEIIAFVNQSLVDPNMSALRRFVSVQDHLLDALRIEDPINALLERLAPLVPAQVALINSTGTVLSSSPGFSSVELVDVLQMLDLPAPGIGSKWNGQKLDKALSTQDQTLSYRSLEVLKEFKIQDNLGLAIAVDSRRDSNLWLTLIQDRRDQEKGRFELALPLIRFAGHMLSVAIETIDQKGEARRAAARSLIGELAGLGNRKFAALPGARPPVERLVDFNIDFSMSVFVIYASRVHASSSIDVADFIASDQTMFQEIPIIWDWSDGVFVSFVQLTREDCEKLVSTLVSNLSLSVGISDPVFSPESLKPGYRQAFAAFGEVSTGDSDIGDLFYSECTMLTWLVAHTDPRALAERREDKLAKLNGEKYSTATLRAYLEANLDVARAATNLSIHPNTIRYRLNRIREILGCDLDQLSDLVELYLALGITNPPLRKIDK